MLFKNILFSHWGFPSEICDVILQPDPLASTADLPLTQIRRRARIFRSLKSMRNNDQITNTYLIGMWIIIENHPQSPAHVWVPGHIVLFLSNTSVFHQFNTNELSISKIGKHVYQIEIFLHFLKLMQTPSLLRKYCSLFCAVFVYRIRFCLFQEDWDISVLLLLTFNCCSG